LTNRYPSEYSFSYNLLPNRDQHTNR